MTDEKEPTQAEWMDVGPSFDRSTGHCSTCAAGRTDNPVPIVRIVHPAGAGQFMGLCFACVRGCAGQLAPATGSSP